METLKHNIVKIYGKRGEDWLAGLPSRIEHLQDSWGLSELKPFPNLSYSYVLAGLQGDIAVILKLSPDADLMYKEAKTLKAFKGFGAVSLLGCKEGALLLERAIPGDLLKNNLPKEKRIEIACKVMKKLHQAPVPLKKNFLRLRNGLPPLTRNGTFPKII